MYYDIIAFFTVILILASLQYTLNKILIELREIKETIRRNLR